MHLLCVANIFFASSIGISLRGCPTLRGEVLTFKATGVSCEMGEADSLRRQGQAGVSCEMGEADSLRRQGQAGVT